MFMYKFLIACALFVAAQASYVQKPVLGGYVAQIQPAATLTVGGYGSDSGYGYAPAYGHDDYAAINRNAMHLAHMALRLPSAGAPIPATIRYPSHYTTGYTAPHYNDVYGAPSYASPATASSAAAAASKVASNVPRQAYAVKSSY